jgi:hypothetical protein
MTTKNKNELDMNKLTKALDNVNNDNIMNLTTRKLMELNLKILKELMLDNETLINYLRKLKGYKYVDEIGDLKQGSFIKWIRITDPNNLVLNQCGLICDIKITDDDVIIICKNFMHRHYTFKMDEVLIFQKLSDQEMVIISALDHLDAEEQKKKKAKQQVKANTRANKNYSKHGTIEDEDDDEDSEEDDSEEDD